MRVLPTHCDACAHSALVDEHAIFDGVGVCPECGGVARTLPGETYTPDDAVLFAHLEATLRDAGLVPLEAAQLAADLDARDRLVPGSGLKHLLAALPSLALLEFVVPREPSALRKAEGMLATLLKAHASHRSQSGFVSGESARSRSTTG